MMQEQRKRMPGWVRRILTTACILALGLSMAVTAQAASLEMSTIYPGMTVGAADA